MDSQLFKTFLFYMLTTYMSISKKIIYEDCIKNKNNKGELYQFEYENLQGEKVALKQYVGHVTLITNVASF